MDAQADTSARWAQIHTVGFPMVGLNCYIGSRTVGTDIRSEYNSIRKNIIVHAHSHYIAISVNCITFSTQYNNACDNASQEICYFQVMRSNDLLHVYLDYFVKN